MMKIPNLFQTATFKRLFSPLQALALLGALLLLMLLSSSLWLKGAEANEPPIRSGLFIDVAIERDEPTSEPTIIRRRLVKVDLAQFNREKPALAGQQLLLNLFEDTSFMAVLKRIESNPSGSYSWLGHIAGIEYSQVTFVIKDNILVGQIAIPQAIYEIRYREGELHEVLQINQAAFPTLLNDTKVPETSKEAPPRSSEASQASQASASDDGSVIDLLVVYTADARAAAGGTTAIENTIELAVAETNQSYQNSDIQQRIFLAHTAEVTYTESGNAGTDLMRLTEPSDGFMDNVHDLRDDYHADEVILITESGGGCGVAWIMENVGADFESNAFGVVLRSCATGNYSFGHELGHNMGMQHDWYVNNSTAPYSYAHGYVNTTDAWRTVMAYNNHCAALGFNCTRLPHWSNPNLTYGGEPMGVSAGTSTACTVGNTANPDCDADGHLTLNNTAATVAQFRLSQNTWVGNSSNWSSTSNWSTGVVPRFMDDVLIPSAPTGGNFPTISADANVRHIILESGATLNLTGGTLNVYGNWEEQGSASTSSSGGTVVFRSNLDQTIEMNDGSNFNLMQIGDGIGTQNVTLLNGSTLEINGDLTLKAGATLDGGSNTINLAGDWEDEGNGFSPNSSTVIFDGTTQTVDKVTLSTLLNEGFTDADGQTCCSSTYLPAGWLRINDGAGVLGFLFGDSGSGGEARRFRAQDNGGTPGAIDSWLLTSAVSLQPDVTYELEYEYKVLNGPQEFKAYVATEQSSAGMLAGTLIDTVSNANNTSYQTASATFTVPTAGTYYLGLRNQEADPGDNYGFIDNVILRATQDITFYNLTINSDSTFNGDVVVQNNLLVASSGLMALGTNNVTVENSVTNNGGLEQTQNISDGSGGTTYQFLTIDNAAGDSTQYYGINITPDDGAALGSTTVRIEGNQDCAINGDDPALIHRCFTITPSSTNSATIRFWFTEAERNGQAADTMEALRYNGASWVQVGSTGSHGSTGTSCTSDISCWYEWTAIDAFGDLAGSTDSPAGPTPTPTSTPTASNTPSSTNTPTPTSDTSPTITTTPMSGTVTPSSTPTITTTPMSSTATPTSTITTTPISGTVTPSSTPTITTTPISGTVTPSSTPTTNTPTPAATATATIDPEDGGTLTSPDGEVELDFPSGAVDNTTTVIYNEQSQPSQSTSQFTFAGTSFSIEAFDENNNPVETFNQNFTLTVHYEDKDWINAGIKSEDDLSLFYWDGSQWVDLMSCDGCSHDTANNTLTVILAHLTEFALLADSISTTPTPTSTPTMTSTATPNSTATTNSPTPTRTPTPSPTTTTQQSKLYLPLIVR